MHKQSMNHVFRVIWNDFLGCWVAVAETVKGRGKSSSTKKLLASVLLGADTASTATPAGPPAAIGVARGRGEGGSRRAMRTWLAMTSAALVSGLAHAELPSGGVIVGGTGNISQSGSVMTINQGSQRMTADWQSFSIGAGNTVNFVQPSASAVALNRVLGNDVSVIQGALRANGQVFLVNPNGVLFTPTAQVNVGSIVASTLQISTSDFMVGNYRLDSNAGVSLSGSSIVNQGNIQAAQGGAVALIAGKVVNTGSLSAPQGNVLMGAGAQVTLDLGGPVKLQVQRGALNALIEQGGVIQADGGVVYLTAQAVGGLSASVINNTGVIEARTLATGEQGQITLLGEGELITVAGTLDASAAQGGVGGRIVATGTHVLVDDSAHLTASGRNGGGQVLVGGSWQNSDASVYQATATLIKAGAVLEANATDRGDGGTVVAWSDITQADGGTRAYGTFQARGGASGGDGGRIETSGHWLDVAGGRADASAPQGAAGQWLLDPYNVTIGSSASGTAYANPFTPGTDSTILASDIAAALEGGTSVTITTGTSGTTSIGDITVSTAITKTTGSADVILTLQAANSVVIDQAITHAGGGGNAGKLNVVLDADNDNGVRDGGGVAILNNNISTGGGNLAFGTGARITLNGVSTLVGGDVYVAGTGARTLSTGGGALTVNGEMLIANTSGLSINTQGGNVSFMGVLNSANQYDFIDKTGSAGSGSWAQARIDAKGATAGGSTIGDTYLVTIGSRLENAVAVRAAGYRGAWIGAWRPDTSALQWKWADGSEAGVNFFNQGAFSSGSSGPGGVNGNPVNGGYQNFGVGEPNGANSPTAENVGQFFGTQGKWNDLDPAVAYSDASATSQYAVKGFVRETNLAASPLTVNAGTGSVTFSGAVGNVKALAALNVTGSTVAINGGAATEGAQTYAATGAVTQGGALKANGLALLGAGGNYTLTNVANNVATLAANTGAVRFTNGTALTVDAVGATHGITATGAVSVETQTGDMTIAQNIVTADTSNAAIVLNAGKATAAGTATGGSVALSGGPTLTLGAGGRATVYTGSISGSTGLTTLVGSGSGNFRYNSDEATTQYTAALDTGLYAIYREQPVAALAIDDKSMTYGNAVPTLTGSVTGMVNGDAVGALALTSPTYSGAGQLNAGGYAITPASLAALGYRFTGSAGALTVGQRALTVGFAGVNKTYDRTASATVTTSDNRVSSDTLTILRTAVFTDTSAGTGKTVNVTGVSLTGADASNYTVAASGSASADITPRALNVTYTGVNKVYDGALAATVNTSDDRLGSDDLTIQRTAYFADKNAQAGKTVSVTGVSLTGADAGNYTVATSGSTTADITARALSITFTGVSKAYDGSTAASVNTSDNRVSGDALTIQRGANFLDPNVGQAKAIVITGVGLSGIDAGNYTLTSTTGEALADITPDTHLESAIQAPQQLPLPQFALPVVLANLLQPPSDMASLDVIGGLKMVYVNSESIPTSLSSSANAGQSTSNSDGSRDTTNSPAGSTFPSAGVDPFGYVRVFVLRGGLNLPAEAQTASDKPDR